MASTELSKQVSTTQKQVSLLSGKIFVSLAVENDNVSDLDASNDYGIHKECRIVNQVEEMQSKSDINVPIDVGSAAMVSLKEDTSLIRSCNDVQSYATLSNVNCLEYQDLSHDMVDKDGDLLESEPVPEILETSESFILLSDNNVRSEYLSKDETLIAESTQEIRNEGKATNIGELYVRCTICSQRFRCERELTMHVQKVHDAFTSTSGQHVCTICGKSFAEKRYLSTHLKRHSGIKRYVCSVCGWRFFEGHKLKFHMETHKRREDQIMPYQCNLCQRKYQNRQAWNDHMNTHSGSRPYKCSKCESTFAHRVGLYRHRLTHEKLSLSCSYCNHSFSTQASLNTHLIIHTKIGKHRCKTCDKVFTVASSLRRHKCISPGSVKRFMCGVCKTTFPSMSLAKVHSYAHTGDNHVVDVTPVQEVDVNVDSSLATYVFEAGSTVNECVIKNDVENTDADFM